MLIAVRQHGQEASAFDSCVELALVNGASASQASGDDLAVFGDEVTQCVDIFVINFLNTCHCEAAKTLALEQKGLGVALGALIIVEFFERGPGAS